MTQALLVASYALDVLALLVMVRVIISWVPGINPFNPLVRWLRRIVDPILAPFRKLLPTFASIDISPLLAILVIYLLADLLRNLAFYGSIDPLYTAASLISQLVLNIIIIVIVVVLLRVVLSLFHADPWHPVTMTIRELSRPFIRPFAGIAAARRSTAVDLAAVFAFIGYLVLYLAARYALGLLVVSLAGR